MKYVEFRQEITGKGSGEGIKEFYIVPMSLGHIPYNSKLEDFPKLSELGVSIKENGRKIIRFGDGFPDPNNVHFFFDREEAEAQTVFLMTRQRMKLVRTLEEFDKKMDYKGRFQKAFEKHPEVFI